jgi:hypothetical protein
VRLATSSAAFSFENANMIDSTKPKFALGQLVATPGALQALTDAGQSPMEFLSRHIRGDWGDCCEDDRQANDDALRYNARLLSVYRTTKGVKFWVITEADRNSTCVLLPEEY